MIIKIDIPDEGCFKPLKRFVDSTFDFELVKMYDICSNQEISYMQILGLKVLESETDSSLGTGVPTSDMLENEWRNLIKSGKVEPLFGNIRQSDTSANATENT